jgi:hypothetical protein|eukprot:COSAG06_NODE_953_length_11329_cov_5.438825_4_plen_42_part_00
MTDLPSTPLPPEPSHCALRTRAGVPSSRLMLMLMLMLMLGS